MKYLFVILQFVSLSGFAQVKSFGSMSEMGKSNFEATIYLDSLSSKTNLIGLGPLGKMQGEITVVDGIPMNARVQEDGSIQVSQSWKLSAPFFVYAEVSQWVKIPINTTVSNLVELQAFIENQAIAMGYDLTVPFPFKLSGSFDYQVIHVVMPRSAEVPGYVAGKNNEKFELTNISGDMIGFYSQAGQGIYTHKDSFIHVHFVSADRTQMGHVDQVEFSGEMMLFLPKK